MKIAWNVFLVAILCAIVFCIGSVTVTIIPAKADAAAYDNITESATEDIRKSTKFTLDEIEEAFAANGIAYYAYMDLNEVPDELKAIVLEARNRIIFSTSWVADEINGWILDEDRNVLETLPHFSEIFPADWEVPAGPDALFAKCRQ